MPFFPPCSWAPYAPSSPFNAGNVKGRKVDPNSERMLEQIDFEPRNAKTGASMPINTPSGAVGSDDWGHPVYWASETDQLYALHQTAEWPDPDLQGAMVRCPIRAKPAGGGDHHLALVQPDGTEISLWGASIDHGARKITAYRGGKVSIIDGSGVTDKAPATAAWFGLSAGIIRACELATGRVNHALFLVPNLTVAPPYPPAKGTARTTKDTAWPHVGQQLVLDMLWSEIDVLPLASYQKGVLRALAEKGGFVGDTGHYSSTPSIQVQVESQQPYVASGMGNPLADFAKTVPGGKLNLGKALNMVKPRLKWLVAP